MRFVMIALATMFVAGTAQAAPLEAYAKLPVMRMPTISPDGTKLAFVQLIDGKEALVVGRLDPASTIVSIPPSKLAFLSPYESLTWVDSNHLAVQRLGLDIIDLEQIKLAPQRDNTGRAPTVRTRGGRTTLFLVWVSQRGEGQLEAVDFATGNAEELARVDLHKSASWQIDPAGNLVAQSLYDEQSHHWTLQVRHGSDWIDAYSTTALIDLPSVVGLTPDTEGLVLQRFTGDQGLEFRRISLGDGKLGGIVPEYSGLKRVIQDSQTGKPIGGVKISLEPSYVFFDAKDQALWDGVRKAFPDEEVEFINWTQNHGKILVRVTGLQHGVSYHVVDSVTHKAIGIGAAFAHITPDDMADTRIVTYSAKDGLPIQALLSVPPGRELRNLPLVVLPHGGPVDSDAVGYNAMAQALASRGYAVLQPQYRGSAGLGWKLESAGFGEWGRKMQTDLSDGVRALASNGYVDPNRVCIVGEQGYGGYAALAGVMFEHGVYRCAVAVDPWTDITKVGGGYYADPQHSMRVRNFERLVGAKDPKDPVFDRISPAGHAADASAPILIVHDPRLGYAPQQMANDLKRAKKPVETVDLDRKSTSEDTLLHTLQATVAFLEKNNPAQ